MDVAIDWAQPEADGLRVHARPEHLDRYAFGVTGQKGMVDRHLDLELDVLARRT